MMEAVYEFVRSAGVWGYVAALVVGAALRYGIPLYFDHSETRGRVSKDAVDRRKQMAKGLAEMAMGAVLVAWGLLSHLAQSSESPSSTENLTSAEQHEPMRPLARGMTGAYIHINYSAIPFRLSEQSTS